jgi:hypothetical protein
MTHMSNHFEVLFSQEKKVLMLGIVEQKKLRII